MKKIFIIIFVLVSEVGFGQGLFSQYRDIRDNFQQCNAPETIKQKKIKGIKVLEIRMDDTTKTLRSITYYNRNGEIAPNIYCIDSISNETISYKRCDEKSISYLLKHFHNGQLVKSFNVNVDVGKRIKDTTQYTTYKYTNDKIIKKDSNKHFVRLEEQMYNSKKQLISKHIKELNSTSSDIELMRYNKKGYLIETKYFKDSIYRSKSIYKYKNHYRKKTAYDYSFSGTLQNIQSFIYDGIGRLLEESRENANNKTKYQKLIYFYSTSGLLDHVDEISVKKGEVARRYAFEYEYYE